MSIVSSLYLSTDSFSNSIMISPISSNNLANVTWYVDWDLIFRGKTGLCKVTVNMISKVGTAPDTWNKSVGIMTANFSSPYTFNTNGLPLCPLIRNQYIEVSVDAQSVTTTAYVFYYQAINEQSTSPPVINIPTGKSPFTIQMLDTQGNYITGFPHYHVFFHFEWL